MTKVLIVDDEPFVIRMLRDKLPECRHFGGERGERERSRRPRHVRAARPDHHGLDDAGNERDRRLQSDPYEPEHAGTPIIMLTAKAEELDEKKGGTRAPHTTSPSLSAPAGSCASWKNALSRPAAGVLSGCGKNVAARTVAFFMHLV